MAGRARAGLGVFSDITSDGERAITAALCLCKCEEHKSATNRRAPCFIVSLCSLQAECPLSQMLGSKVSDFIAFHIADVFGCEMLHQPV